MDEVWMRGEGKVEERWIRSGEVTRGGDVEERWMGDGPGVDEW